MAATVPDTLAWTAAKRGVAGHRSCPRETLSPTLTSGSPLSPSCPHRGSTTRAGGRSIAAIFTFDVVFFRSAGCTPP